MSDIRARLNAALGGRYRVERELGEGGMATVFLADDLKHGRRVAIKVLKPELAAVVGAERFLAEIKTTANLQHPHILPLHDSGEAAGFLFYVMPYVEGDSLRDRLDREKQLPVDEAVRIASDLAEALDHAHRRGIVHRDIKPANVLLQDGRPAIADFGIALAVGTAGGARLTETGLSLGTPYYMSPEQALGDQAVTSASDIYALGCVLYEMLAGEPPHTAGTSQAVLARIITGESRPVREHRPSVPSNVDAALRRALERVPADRFPSAEALRDALHDPDFRYGAAGESRGPGWRAVAAAAGLALAVGVGIGMAVTDSGGSTGPEARPLQLTFTGQARMPGISPDGTFAAYADVACRQGSFGLCSYSLRVKEVGSTSEVTVLEGAEWIGPPRWTYDGATVVVAAVLDDRRQGVYALPRMGGALRSVAPLGQVDTHATGDSLLVVPAGDTPLFNDEHAVAGEARHGVIIDLATAAVVDSIPLPGDQVVWGLSWHPEGKLVAVYHEGSLEVLTRDGAVAGVRVFPGGRTHIRWNAAGDGILQFKAGAVREDDFVKHVVGRAGEFTGPAQLVKGGVPTIYSGQFDVARETGRVVLATGDARRDLWSFRTDGPVASAQRRTGGTTWYGGPQISWDGGTIFYLRGDARGDNLYALSLETGEEEALTASIYPGGWAVRLSHDGSRLVYTRLAGGDGRVIEVVEFPSRRVRTASNVEFRTRPVPVGERRLLGFGVNTILLFDSLGASPRVLDTGELPTAGFLGAVHPSGDLFAFLSEATPSGYSLVSRSIDDNDATVLATLADDSYAAGLTWTPRGELFVGRWRGDDPHPTLWRWDPDRLSLVRVTEIRAPCEPRTFTVDAAGSRGACMTEESRWDVWAFEGLGR